MENFNFKPRRIELTFEADTTLRVGVDLTGWASHTELIEAPITVTRVRDDVVSESIVLDPHLGAQIVNGVLDAALVPLTLGLLAAMVEGRG